MRSCLQNLRKEFDKKNFGFRDVHPDRFATSQWQWRFKPIIYIIYRITLAIYADFWLIFTASKSRFSKIKFTGWPYALTNWTYFMESLYLTMHAFGVILHYFVTSKSACQRKPLFKHIECFNEANVSQNTRSNEYIEVKDTDAEDPGTDSKLPLYFKVVWILYNIASVGAFLVTLVYYAILWPNREPKGPAQLEDIQLHGINSVIIFTEHCVSAVPVRLLHAVYPAIYGFTYVIFSIILWAYDNNHVSYEDVLEWKEPDKSILAIVLLTIIVLPLLQLIFFAIYKLKMHILNRISMEESI